MATRTHTTYFNDDSLAGLRRENEALRANYERRAPHITDEARLAISGRLAILDYAIRLLAEPVPPQFGG